MRKTEEVPAKTVVCYSQELKNNFRPLFKYLIRHQNLLLLLHSTLMQNDQRYSHKIVCSMLVYDCSCELQREIMERLIIKFLFHVDLRFPSY